MKLLFFLILVISGLTFSQSCTYTEKIRDGKTAFERKRYFQASEMLKDEYDNARSNIERGNIAYLIGESNLKFNNIPEAGKWFKTAYDLGYGSSALLQLAYCLKQNEQYQDAANSFYTLGNEIENATKYRKEIAYCMQAADWKKDVEYSPYQVSTISINSPGADYAPIPLAKNKIAFTSDRVLSEGEEFYAWTGQKFSDIFIADIGSKQVTDFEASINTDDNEGTLTLNKEATKMVFCRCFSRDEYDLHCKLMFSEKSGGSWAKPEILPFVKDGVNYRQPAFFGDGTGLIFSANIDESTRGYDLYISYYLKDEDSWSEPISIGGRVNTEGNESFPSFHDDTLYYSSDYAGMGGLDVFMTYPLSDGSWAPAINLLAPINSGYDDFAFVVDPYSALTDSILQTGYFCSSRQGGKGKDDIYRFEKIKYAKERPEEVVDFEYEIVLDFRTYQKLYEDPEDPNSKVKMRVPLEATTIRITEDGNLFSTTTSDEYGILSLKLNAEKEYEFFVSHEGFFNNQHTFSTRNLVLDSSKYTQRYEDQILLEKVFYDKEVVLDNIYYDLDRAEIRADAEPPLNELAELLLFNPQIRIQLSSHTDCRAADDYNIDLSQRRADSAIHYLMNKGIDAARLVAVGYGETRLAIDCVCEECAEEQHQANRRTTFKVIE